MGGLFAVFVDEIAAVDFAGADGLVRGLSEGDEVFEDFGVLIGDVNFFLRVRGEVVEFPIFLSRSVGFPLVFSDGGLVDEFPVEVGVFLLAAFFQESGGEGEAVGFGGGGSGEVGEGGHDVGEVGEVVGDASFFDLFGPADEEGDLEAAFVEGAFSGAEALLGFGVEIGAEETMRSLGSFEVVLSPVITAEEDDGVVIDLLFFEQSNNFTELAVDHVHEGGVDFGVLVGALAGGPGFVFEELPGGVVFVDTPESVRRGPGEVAEEGGLVVLFDELEGLFKDFVLRVGFAFVETGAVVSGKRDLFAISNEVAGVKSVGVDLVVVAEEFIEAVLLRDARGVAAADAPFPESSGGVALGLEHAGEGGFVGADGGEAIVAAHGSVAGVESGEEDAAGGTADGGSGVGVGEAHAFAGELVDVGREEFFAAHVAGLEVAPFVEHEVDDVWPDFLLRQGSGGQVVRKR